MKITRNLFHEILPTLSVRNSFHKIYQSQCLKGKPINVLELLEIQNALNKINVTNDQLDLIKSQL